MQLCNIQIIQCFCEFGNLIRHSQKLVQTRKTEQPIKNLIEYYDSILRMIGSLKIIPHFLKNILILL